MQRFTRKTRPNQPRPEPRPTRAPRQAGRTLAGVAGVVSATGALAILLQDGWRTGSWSLEHGLIPLLMLVQILSGHLFVTALRGGWRKGLSAAGFAAVAAVATWAVLYTSIGKQAETAGPQLAAAAENARQRAKTARMLADAEFMLAACPAGTAVADVGTKCGLRARQAAECSGGKGRRCDGVTYSITTYEAAIKGYKGELAAAPLANPAQRAERVASLIGRVSGADVKALTQVLAEIEAAVYALVFELAALVSFGFAFGHARPAKAAGEPDHNDPAHNDNTTPSTTPPADKAPLPAKTETGEVVSWVKAFRARNGRDPQIPELQARFPGTPKTTAWRRCKAA